ncbi:hypothetical protein DFH06DRAFT_1391090 [Mycena polygramma]|nr:hypothetical protein DFH06DRAFT_1391090 [Mycena polygramma]
MANLGGSYQVKPGTISVKQIITWVWSPKEMCKIKPSKIIAAGITIYGNRVSPFLQVDWTRNELKTGVAVFLATTIFVQGFDSANQPIYHQGHAMTIATIAFNTRDKSTSMQIMVGQRIYNFLVAETSRKLHLLQFGQSYKLEGVRNMPWNIRRCREIEIKGVRLSSLRLREERKGGKGVVNDPDRSRSRGRAEDRRRPEISRVDGEVARADGSTEGQRPEVVRTEVGGRTGGEPEVIGTESK